MKRSKKIEKQLSLFVLFGLIAVMSQSVMQAESDYSFNVMVDCAYPISKVQAFRETLNQCLYALQQNNYQAAFDVLQGVESKVIVRHMLSEDDRDYIQAMIDQINALIAQLEQEKERSAMNSVIEQMRSLFL